MLNHEQFFWFSIAFWPKNINLSFFMSFLHGLNGGKWIYHMFGSRRNVKWAVLEVKSNDTKSCELNEMRNWPFPTIFRRLPRQWKWYFNILFKIFRHYNFVYLSSKLLLLWLYVRDDVFMFRIMDCIGLIIVKKLKD